MEYPKIIPHWIENEEIQEKGVFAKFNPATGETIGNVSGCSIENRINSIRLSKIALEGWREVSVIKRGEILRQAAQIMESRKNEIAEIVALETGKSPKDALGETQAVIELGYFIAGEGRRFYGQTTTSAIPHRFAYTTRQPVGICALITSFNTPIANAAWKVFPALLCGNTAIIKPSEYTPYSAVWLAKILKEAGLPSGVLSVLQGQADIGQFLVKNTDVDLVSFTGSVAVGKYIQKTAGVRLARVCLELGGKNPLIVCDDANLDRAVECAVLSAFSNAGQRCASASRIIIFDSIYEKFKQKMCDKTLALKIGPTDEDDLGPVISFAQYKQILKSIQITRQVGAIILTGGKHFNHTEFPCGYYIMPTIIEGADPNSAISQKELFGPVTCLYQAENLAKAVNIANNSRFGLTGAIHTQNIHRARYFKENYRAGVISINGPTYGSEPHLPFGGLHDSGNGWREPGTQALDIYSEWKTVYERCDPNLI